jgi:hypothetical protein
MRDVRKLGYMFHGMDAAFWFSAVACCTQRL